MENSTPTVVILGATGMLGSAVYNVLKDKCNLVLAVRDKSKVNALKEAYGWDDRHKVVEFDAAKAYEDYKTKKGHPGEHLAGLLQDIDQADWVINAIGITIPFSLDNEALTFFVNSALPHLLARELGNKLIHITTDCAFSGFSGAPYDESSAKTPVDIYGLSKSLGEPENCLTLRTSIIGRELSGFSGLMEWFINQSETQVNGFTNHFWNGITTHEFGKICDRLISGEVQHPGPGIYHVFSNDVSKYDMLVKFKEKFKLSTQINPAPAPVAVDRRLATSKAFNQSLNIPTFDQMIEEMP